MEINTLDKKPVLDAVLGYLNDLASESGSDMSPTLKLNQYQAKKGETGDIVAIMDITATYPNGKEYNVVRMTNDIFKDDLYNFELAFYDSALRALLFQKDEVRLSDVLIGNIDGIKDEVQSETTSN